MKVVFPYVNSKNVCLTSRPPPFSPTTPRPPESSERKLPEPTKFLQLRPQSHNTPSNPIPLKPFRSIPRRTLSHPFRRDFVPFLPVPIPHLHRHTPLPPFS